MKPGDIGFRIVYEDPTIVATYTLLRKTANGWCTWSRRGAGAPDDEILKDQSELLVHATPRLALEAEVRYLAWWMDKAASVWKPADDAEMFRAASNLHLLCSMLPMFPCGVPRSHMRDG